MTDAEARNLEIRREAARTIEAAAFKSYCEFCTRIGIAPKPLEQWREDTQRAFRERSKVTDF